MSRQEFWRGRKVFITGANGFLGSWLARALVSHGAEVVALVRDRVAQGGLRLQGVEDSVTLVNGDLTDYALLERTLNEYWIDSCFHVAAQAIVSVANRSPLSTFESNIRGTWHLLEACRSRPEVTCIVIASSDKAYGDHAQLPYEETLSLNGAYPYDASKACAVILASCYARTFELPLAITRCANLYGGGDLNFSRLIPDTMRAVLEDQDPIIRSDGTLVRDYMYVQDGVEGYLLLAEKIEQDHIKGEAFNFGAERPISVLDLVAKIIELSGRQNLKPSIRGKGKPHAEIDRQYLSSHKAAKFLGWKAQRDLDSGLIETLKWYEAFFAQN
ncbi:MAG: GDP-mannose 4,6-dehydratase [Anaerolineales bacterium]